MANSHRSREETLNLARAKETLSTLFSLVNDVAYDVDRYSSNVTASTKELSSLIGTEDGFFDFVVQAVERIVESNDKLQHQLTLADSKLQQQKRLLEQQI